MVIPIPNPFSISFGGTTVGGDIGHYQLQGPQVLERSYQALRVVFDVQVVAEDTEDLQLKSAALEAAFAQRLSAGQLLVLTMGPASWIYTHGSTLLNAEASISKPGNPEGDNARTRLYTVSISAELPADDADDAGLRDVEVIADKDASGRRRVTMRGVYTATSGGDAQSLYRSRFDSIANAYLSAIKSSATWELVDESEGWDRQRTGSTPTPHSAPFFRQYVELIADQDTGIRDVAAIKDHRFALRDQQSHPGDSSNADRLIRVNGTFDCAVDIEETTDLRDLIDNTIREFVKAEFQNEFQPQVFAIDAFTGGFDKTTNRVACAFEFIYQRPQGDLVVESRTSLTYVESRRINYVPTHGRNELGMYAHQGWTELVRVWERQATVVGAFGPIRRLTAAARNAAPGFTDTIGGDTAPDSRRSSRLNRSGWNLIENRSGASVETVGASGEDQFDLTRLTEVITERYHERPGTTTSSGP